MNEILEELHDLSEYELGSEWMRAYNTLQEDLRIWVELHPEEREFVLQRASYLVNEGNRLYREEL